MTTESESLLTIFAQLWFTMFVLYTPYFFLTMTLWIASRMAFSPIP